MTTIWLIPCSVEIVAYVGKPLMRGCHVVIEGQSMFRRLSAPTTFQRMRVACTPLRILVDPLVDSIQTKMQYPEIRSHGPPRRVPESFHEKDPSHTVTVFCSADRPRHKFAKMSKQVLDRASCNFTGLVCDETVQVHAIGTPRKYGVVNCGRPEFYGTIAAMNGIALKISTGPLP
ncbi:hypothetical protein V8E53_002990 [Lactarius tabidus]